VEQRKFYLEFLCESKPRPTISSGRPGYQRIDPSFRIFSERNPNSYNQHGRNSEDPIGLASPSGKSFLGFVKR
jgi:hypothetical protein